MTILDNINVDLHEAIKGLVFEMFGFYVALPIKVLNYLEIKYLRIW